MIEHTSRFHVDAPRQRVWRALHPKPPVDRPPGPRVIEYQGGRIEILEEGNDAGQGLVRICRFKTPKYLLSGGWAQSWECITEARLYEFSRYVAVGKPLWSRAEGYHELIDAEGGGCELTFYETYHAHNPILRALLEERVHRFISKDNHLTYLTVLGFCGTVTELTGG